MINSLTGIQPEELYATGDLITQSDILNDVFEFAEADAHDEFLAWAGEKLGVRFTFNEDESLYLVEIVK